MRLALEEAEKAFDADEVPVGAVIVRGGAVIASAHNSREIDRDATRHAEINAISEACRRLGGWRLPGCEMYVTLEPCPMCAGALVNARVERVYYGASDQKAGACGSVMNIADNEMLNHRVEIFGGILEEECSGILKKFFKNKRIKKAMQMK